MLGTMSNRRLLLLEPGEHDWRLDDDTRRRGKAGVAMARAALAEAVAETLTDAYQRHAA
jgi:hypothetical protein